MADVDNSLGLMNCGLHMIEYNYIDREGHSLFLDILILATVFLSGFVQWIGHQHRS
uniref:Uncharacterized protein n=1 Tax=Arundo donax TaxID=35708 RepID=A0A0A9AKG9_ARUDO